MEETMRKKVRKGCANVIANAVRQNSLNIVGFFETCSN